MGKYSTLSTLKMRAIQYIQCALREIMVWAIMDNKDAVCRRRARPQKTCTVLENSGDGDSGALFLDTEHPSPHKFLKGYIKHCDQDVAKDSRREETEMNNRMSV